MTFQFQEHFSFRDTSVLHVSFSDISVSVTVQFQWYFSSGDISVSIQCQSQYHGGDLRDCQFSISEWVSESWSLELEMLEHLKRKKRRNRVRKKLRRKFWCWGQLLCMSKLESRFNEPTTVFHPNWSKLNLQLFYVWMALIP